MYMKNSGTDLAVIGAGPAGMMAAVTAARRGGEVILLDPNPKAGKKLRITGKGRCNVTNDCRPQELLEYVRTNARFFKSALYAFPPSDVMEFFESEGVPLKTERGGRVFPVSDNANDIADALIRAAERAGVRFIHERVTRILTTDGAVSGVRTAGREIPCRAAAVCTGGLSYPATGSTGDGYELARTAGHTVRDPHASLVPWEAEPVCARMQGLSLRNVTLSLYQGGDMLFREQGEMLFTHFGVSGPLMLSASTWMHPGGSGYRLEIDLKPALSQEKLDERILRDFGQSPNKDLINALDALLPQKMIPVIVERSGIRGRTKVHSVTRAQRLQLRDLMKSFPVRLTAPRPITEAIVTAGGVDVTEIEPRTMASRLLPGLYFAGEVLDLDARTGGFNLQIAWSTGRALGRSVPIEEAR